VGIEGADKIDKITFDFMDRVLKKDVKDRMSLAEMKAHIYFADIDFDTFPLAPKSSPIDHSNDPHTVKTYFIDGTLKPARPHLFTRFGLYLGRFVGGSIKLKFTAHSSAPATGSLSTVFP